MTYRKAIGPPEAYYTQDIQYLHYTPLDSISHEFKLKIATDISLAALPGDGVYNFGEVVHNNEILGALERTDNKWLVHPILLEIERRSCTPKKRSSF